MSKQPQIKIRPFQDENTKGVINLISSIQQREFGLAITPSEQPDLSDIRGFYQQGTGNFWVAEYENEIRGSIALLDIGNQNAALRKMFVHSSCRGDKTGIAKALLKTLIQWAEKKQIKHIYLGTTPLFLAAHRFYEKNGFIEITKENLPETFPIMRVDTKFYRLTI